MLLGARMFFSTTRKQPVPYDHAVEWLQSDGSAYIYLDNVSARDNLLVSFRTYIDSSLLPANEFYVTGSNNGGGTNNGIYFGRRLFSGTTALISGLNDGRTTKRGESFDLDTWHEIILDTTSNLKSCIVDERTVRTSSQSSSYVGSTGMYLFYNGSTVLGNSNGVRISNFSVKDTFTNQMLVDLIPVRFTNELGNSEGAMYDTVSGSLLCNANMDGSFTIGDDT